MKRNVLIALVLVLCASTFEGCIIVRGAGKVVDGVVTGASKVVKAITP